MITLDSALNFPTGKTPNVYPFSMLKSTFLHGCLELPPNYLCQLHPPILWLNQPLFAEKTGHETWQSSGSMSHAQWDFREEVMQVSFGGFNSPEKRIKWRGGKHRNTAVG